MKIGWGYRIALLYVGFISLIIFLVYRSTQVNFDLVTKDYYSEELKFQQLIDAGKNQSALSAPVALSLQGKEVHLRFPAEFSNMQVKGTVQFFSMVNAEWDKTVAFDTKDSPVVISVDGMQPATYTVKLKWSEGSKSYYQESDLNIH